MIRDTPLCYGMQELWRTHSYSSKNFRKNTREYGTINQNNMRIKKYCLLYYWYSYLFHVKKKTLK